MSDSLNMARLMADQATELGKVKAANAVMQAALQELTSFRVGSKNSQAIAKAALAKAAEHNPQPKE